MALNLATSAQVILDRIKSDVASALPGSSPGLRKSFLLGFLTGIANRFFDFILDLRDVLRESNPGTAFFTREDWAASKGVIRLSGVKSSGFLKVTSTTLTGPIPSGTRWSASNGREYVSTLDATIIQTDVNINSIIDSGGGEAVVLCDAVHGYAGGEDVVISGCVVDTAYNATHLNIEFIDTTSFRIFGHSAAGDETAGSPAITSTFSADTPVEATEVGQDGDLAAGATVTLNSPIPGLPAVKDTAATELGVDGGVDQETSEAHYARYLEEVRDPIAHFNVSDIRSTAKTVNGVTRVFVEENTPAVGAVRVFFMRDEDDDPIPTASEVTAVDDVLQGIRPATTVPADLDVLAPTPEVVNFIFDALSPNTLTMQAAIEANLAQYFAEETSVGVDVSEDGIRAAIITTTDTVTGERVVSFNYTTPASGDITIAAGEIGKLGSFVWP